MRSSAGYAYLLPLGLLTFGGYFIFAAVQGDTGIFRRIELEAQRAELRGELDLLELQVAELRDRTRRLSDDFLDVDLLDERARDVLGFARADELIVD